MKKITLTFAIILTAISLIAQPPQAFKYQAVVRDNAGNILANQNVSFRINILQGSATGTAVYVEAHDTVTNQFGLINLEIGNGNVISGAFSDINWSTNIYFLQIELDETGGANYQQMGTSQLLSVPFALEAEHARSLTLTGENGRDYDVTIDENGNLVLFTEWLCGDTITDPRDNKKYATVLIGSQCWMAENLNIGTRIDGAGDQTDNSIIEKYCYGNLESNCNTYGGLYQWNEMMQYTTTQGVHGICPPDWHIPTDGESTTLVNYLGGSSIAGGKMKEAGTAHWNPPNTGATNESGFTALPSGYRYDNGNFLGLGNNGYFWSSSEHNTYNAWLRVMYYNSDVVSRNFFNKNYGFPVRCIQGYTNQPPSQPTNPMPENGSIDIGIDTVLSWTCSDPDGDNLVYKAYFGTTDPPPFEQAGLTEATYDPGTLDYNTTYYWKVVAFDSYGDSAVSNVWNFTTESDPVFNCGDVLVDARDGQNYNTVQIGTQCWMANNLNIGTMINGNGDQTNNGIIEKYCYNNEIDSCNKYGGYYQWNEMMQYSTVPGIQGICLDGWHIPTDDEWKYLEGVVDSLYPVGDPIWDTPEWRGFDVGKNLKTTYGWYDNNNGTDLFGFSALPAGYRRYAGEFVYIIGEGHFWSSNEASTWNAIWRYLSHIHDDINRHTNTKAWALSLRCIID